MLMQVKQVKQATELLAWVCSWHGALQLFNFAAHQAAYPAGKGGSLCIHEACKAVIRSLQGRQLRCYSLHATNAQLPTVNLTEWVSVAHACQPMYDIRL